MAQKKKTTSTKKKAAPRGKAAPKKKAAPKPRRKMVGIPTNVSGQKSVPKKKAVSKKKPAPRVRGKLKEGVTKIKVVGIGGAGGNIITRMRAKSRIRGVEYVAVNTDAQDLNHTSAHRKIYIGRALTKGLGTGMNPEVGKQAAEENRSEIGEMLEGTDMVFLTAGFGGGTGTGATPVVAEIAKQLGILTVAIITKPFSFEGGRRMSIAQDGIERLREHVDALVVIPNDRVFAIISKDTPVVRAFAFIDDVLNHGVQAIGDLINAPGIINLDFADTRTILQEAGPSLIGVGVASGGDRAVKAVEAAINSPLLETAIDGAKGVLFSVSGGRDMKMAEVNDIAKSIVANLDSGAKVIFGAYYDRSLRDKSIKVTVIATGFSGLFTGERQGSVPHLFSKERTPGERAVIGGERVLEEESVEGLKPSKGKPESKSELWDIPAFLRKKKK